MLRIQSGDTALPTLTPRHRHDSARHELPNIRQRETEHDGHDPERDAHIEYHLSRVGVALRIASRSRNEDGLGDGDQRDLGRVGGGELDERVDELGDLALRQAGLEHVGGDCGGYFDRFMAVEDVVEDGVAD